MTGKELLEQGRLWTESALDEALHLVAPGAPHRRLTDDASRELRRKIEDWLKDAPVGADLNATLRLDGSWDAKAMSARLDWLGNAGIIKHQTGGQGESDLANSAGIVIAVPAKAPPSHHRAPPTERFSQVMEESGLARVYLVGGCIESASEGAQRGRWSEIVLHRRGTQAKPATDMIWVDPALHGSQSTLGQGLPESEVILKVASDSVAHVWFQGKSLGESHFPDDFAKWCLILRVALATSAAIGCLEASKWAKSAQAKKQDDSPVLFAKLGEMFQSRAVEILRLAVENSSI